MRNVCVDCGAACPSTSTKPRERCDACRKVRRKHYSVNHNPPAHMRPDGTIAVTCWCEANIVMVDRRAVIAGRTHSCGRRGCAAPVAA